MSFRCISILTYYLIRQNYSIGKNVSNIVKRFFLASIRCIKIEAHVGMSVMRRGYAGIVYRSGRVFGSI